jgi:hypothetical protein
VRAGWIVLGLGVTSGVAVIASGMGSTLLGLIVGLALVFDGDEAHVHLPNLAP